MRDVECRGVGTRKGVSPFAVLCLGYTALCNVLCVLLFGPVIVFDGLS